MSTGTHVNANDNFFSSRLKQFLLVAAAALVITTALSLRTDSLTYTHPDFNNPWDHHKYIWMSEHNPFGFHVAPFCWRVVTPTLARALPFDTRQSFFLISFISVWMTGVVLFYLARTHGFSKWTALAGMLMFFTLGWAAKSNLWNIWKPDPLGFLVITLAAYAITARKDGLFALLLVVGVGVKESVLFVWPLYYTLRAQRAFDPALALRTLLLAVPGIAALVLLRVFIPALNDNPEYIGGLPGSLTQVQLGSSAYSLGWAWEHVGLPRLQDLSAAEIFRYTFGTYGAVALTLPFFSIRRSAERFVRFLPFLVLVYIQIMFATNAERLLVIGFPAVVMMALGGVDAIGRVFGVNAKLFLVLFGVLILLMVVKVGLIVVPFKYEALLFLVFLAAGFVLDRLRRGLAHET